jgi:hypothetical protein
MLAQILAAEELQKMLKAIARSVVETLWARLVYGCVRGYTSDSS